MIKSIKSIKNPVTLIIMFLLPGILVATAYALLINPILALELPKTVALGIAALVVMIPVELGIIYYHSKKQFGFFSIKKMIPYTNTIAIKTYLWLVPLLLSWSVCVIILGKKVDEFIKTSLFSWIPDWYILSVDYMKYNKSQLFVAFIVSLIITGIIIPIVEEIYFRGFLLPRMEWLGKAAPIVNASLFALYHFWSPWQIPTRIIALIPFCYASYKTRNIKITIIVHCLLNILGDAVGLLILLLQ